MKRQRFAKPKLTRWWMLIRYDGSWVGDDSPFLYATKRDAMDSGWSLATNPAKAIRVAVLPR